MNYAGFAFTDAIKVLQEKKGSREGYAHMEKNQYTEGLGDFEKDFIENRDSFYLATIGENGYPYIQHRGGPKGFIRVLNDKTIGIVDFRGNKQYISVGNVSENPHVSLILMDYPRRARMKIYADLRIVEINEDPGLFLNLDPSDYKHQSERMMIFEVRAFDWNCPQHITPRYTADEINEAFAQRNEYVAQLEREVQELRAKLKTG
ncbi:hypothetical protein SAMN04515674_11439 [Pseudarcicella hirudinis]|uniref:Pyridoxamine 5'-phosphate oxidase N-terminal domain-containing protein n=1 Tax=Pseudarcicella hirudinis TaxID=1079859 RepID=A0A1I5XAZ3_9BACT|nr:pyridoxamine 5'-phosphate oxidase family protein [Pseudarcicella hirudinis]SFQ29091.1 hypothetical protein SAMN04515674_11439 [Pseudarcicella hirudinis]